MANLGFVGLGAMGSRIPPRSWMRGMLLGRRPASIVPLPDPD
jgi:hypothetical protein